MVEKTEGALNQDIQVTFIEASNEDRTRLMHILENLPKGTWLRSRQVSGLIKSGAPVYKYEEKNVEGASRNTFVVTYSEMLEDSFLLDCNSDALLGMLTIRRHLAHTDSEKYWSIPFAPFVQNTETFSHGPETSHKKRLSRGNEFSKWKYKLPLHSSTEFKDPRAEKAWQDFVAQGIAVVDKEFEPGRKTYKFVI